MTHVHRVALHVARREGEASLAAMVALVVTRGVGELVDEGEEWNGVRRGAVAAGGAASERVDLAVAQVCQRLDGRRLARPTTHDVSMVVLAVELMAIPARGHDDARSESLRARAVGQGADWNESKSAERQRGFAVIH